MKKRAVFLVPFLLITPALLGGCGNDKPLLSFGDVHVNETIHVSDLTDLNEHIDNKENFLLVVSTKTCGCWDEFQITLNEYIKNNHVICYEVAFNDISAVASVAYNLNKLSKSTTTFAIFENGKVKTTLVSSENKDVMNDYKKFEKYMNDTVRLPKCFLINEEDYWNIKNSGKNAVIYFARSGCGDCNALNPGILRSYMVDHSKMNNIYVLDCQDYWRGSADPEYDQYLEKKRELGMTEGEGSTNPLYGFGTGVFPFFSYIRNGEYASGCVIYNHRVVKQDNSYVLTSSYYTSERVARLEYNPEVLEGKAINVNELELNEDGTRAKWIVEKADIEYKKILTKFLDYSLKEVTFTF